MYNAIYSLWITHGVYNISNINISYDNNIKISGICYDYPIYNVLSLLHYL